MKKILSGILIIFLVLAFVQVPVAALSPPAPTFVGKVNIFGFNDGWFYYSYYLDGSDRHGDGLYRMRVDGTGKSKILEREEIAHPSIKWLNWFRPYFYDGWIYFSNTADNFTLYKMRYNGTEKSKLNDVSSFPGLIFSDNWIYYSFEDSNREHFMRMRKDGSEMELLRNTDLWIIHATDDWFFYQKSDNGNLCLYKISINATGAGQQIAVALRTIHIADDWIYYINTCVADANGMITFDPTKNRLHRMRMDGTGEMQLDDIPLFHSEDEFFFSDGRIYYKVFVNNAITIRSLRTDGVEKIDLKCDDLSYIIAVEDGWIYYQSESERIGNSWDERYEEIQGEIYALRIDGTEKREVVFNSAMPLASELSSWAEIDVRNAITANLVPQSLQSNYTQTITRAECCALAVAMYENIKWYYVKKKNKLNAKIFPQYCISMLCQPTIPYNSFNALSYSASY